MLAVLLVKMEWDKNSRTPAGSAERQEYFNPIMEEVCRDAGAEMKIFIKKERNSEVSRMSGTKLHLF